MIPGFEPSFVDASALAFDSTIPPLPLWVGLAIGGAIALVSTLG